MARPSAKFVAALFGIALAAYLTCRGSETPDSEVATIISRQATGSNDAQRLSKLLANAVAVEVVLEHPERDGRNRVRRTFWFPNAGAITQGSRFLHGARLRSVEIWRKPSPKIARKSAGLLGQAFRGIANDLAAVEELKPLLSRCRKESRIELSGKRLSYAAGDPFAKNVFRLEVRSCSPADAFNWQTGPPVLLLRNQRTSVSWWSQGSPQGSYRLLDDVVGRRLKPVCDYERSLGGKPGLMRTSHPMSWKP